MGRSQRRHLRRRSHRHVLSMPYKNPISKGGKNTRDNLRLVTYDVNIVKNSLSDFDFLTICRKVIAMA